MKIEEIFVGSYYHVNFNDPNYPCNCECHNPGENVMHIAPCCYDRSYNGVVKVISKFEDATSSIITVDKVKNMDGSYKVTGQAKYSPYRFIRPIR